MPMTIHLDFIISNEKKKHIVDISSTYCSMVDRIVSIHTEAISY